MQQAAVLDGLSFDRFPPNGLPVPGVDVGWREIPDAFVVSAVVVMIDEVANLGLEIEQAKRFKELERENARLKRLVVELSLEK